MNIFITLDYELFLGDVTGTPKNCLIRPMDALCNSLEKYKIKFIIFVDAAYLLRMFQLKEMYLQVKRDYMLVTNHVKHLSLLGHDIQLHFHPQWLYSSWAEEENIWQLDLDHYKLSDMNKDFAFNSFREAKSLLDNIIEKKTYAFRAGGYSLETFADYIELLKINDICIDSSLSRGANIKSKQQEYDYRDIPEEIIYHFDNNIKEESQTGGFKELSISSCTWNPFFYFFVIRPKLLNYHPQIIFKDGKGIISINEHNRYKKISKLFQMKIFQACIDGAMSNVIDDVYQYALKKKQENIVFIGHPKNFSDQSIRNLANFVNERYDKNRFATTQNLR